MTSDPIIASKYMDPAGNRGLLRLGRKIRNASELPRVEAHQVLVLRVQGRYVVDKGGPSRDHDEAKRASHVSVVDLGAGVPIAVQLTMASAEASDFTVRVTFACTVIDPACVVRENIRAEAALLAYLRRDQKLAHLGLRYRMSEINDVRRAVHGRIRAYTEVRPPDVLGMQVLLDGVEVLTPAELAAFEKARREARAAHLIESEKLGYSRDLEIDQEQHTQQLESSRRRARHAAADEEQQHTHETTARDKKHERLLRAEEMKFAEWEVEQAVAVIGDPVRALVWAQRQGEIDVKELVERMTADLHRQEDWERQQTDLDRDEHRRQLDWDRDQERADRDDRRTARQEAREDRRAEWLAQLEDRRKARQEAREDTLLIRQEARDDRNRQLETNVDLLRELAKHGHIDMVNIEIDRLLEKIFEVDPEVLTGRRQEELAASDRIPIEAGRAGADHTEASGNAGESDEPDAIDLDFDGGDAND